MPEQMTKQDAIEYLLYMKHDVHAKSPMDITIDTAIEALKQPTIEAEPVRHGRWIPYGRDTAYTKYYRCSLCGYEIAGYAEIDDLIKYNYCPNCGADMREVSKDADDN